MAVTLTFTFHDSLRAVAARMRTRPRWDGSEAPVSLARGALWSTHTRGGEPLVLTCGNGQLWLTCEGDARDYVLGPGDTLRLEAPGHWVVQALRPARFCLTWRTSELARATRPQGPAGARSMTKRSRTREGHSAETQTP